MIFAIRRRYECPGRDAAHRAGRPAKSLQIALRRGTLVLSQALLLELITVLQRPYFAARVDALSRATFPLELSRIAELASPTTTFRICRDPKDDRVLEVAVEGHADFIITGDDDLLALDPFQGVRIVNPATFLTLIGTA